MIAAAASETRLPLALDALAVVVELGGLAQQQIVVLVALALQSRPASAAVGLPPVSASFRRS